MRKCTQAWIISLLLVAGISMSSVASAQTAGVSPAVVSQVQAQFGGKVVGVQATSPETADIQVLQGDGKMVIVTVNQATGQVVNVRR